MFSSSASSAMMQPFFQSCTATRAAQAILQEFGPDVMLAVFFCAGFMVFRLNAVQTLLFGSAWTSKCAKAAEIYGEPEKDDRPQCKPEEPNTADAQARVAEVGDVHLRDQASANKDNNVVEGKMLIAKLRAAIGGAMAVPDLTKAWDTVEHLRQAGGALDSFTCCILLKGSKQALASENVDKVVRAVEMDEIMPDSDLIVCLLSACVHLRDVQRVDRVLGYFSSKNVSVPQTTYVSALRSAGHSQNIDMARCLWTQATTSMPSELADATLVSMVDVCLAFGYVAEGVSVLTGVKDRLSTLSSAPQVFASVLKACIQQKQVSKAFELYNAVKEDLEEIGKSNYNLLIDGLVREGDMVSASQLFREMSARNVMPDSVTYSMLIKGHCSNGDLEQGLQILGLMKRRRIVPDVVLFHSILEACAQKEMRTLTEQVLADMEVEGIAPSNATLSILVKLYGRCGDIDAAFAAICTYPRKFNFQLSAQVYSSLVSACIANSQTARALCVFDDMVTAGFEADTKLHQAILTACIRDGELDGADELIRTTLENAEEGASSRMDRATLEAFLLATVRQGRKDDIAKPLVSLFEEAGIAISQRVIGVVRAAD